MILFIIGISIFTVNLYLVNKKIGEEYNKLIENLESKNKELENCTNRIENLDNIKKYIEVLNKENNIFKDDINRYQFIINNIFDSVFFLNSKDKIVYSNKKSEKMFLYKADEFSNKNIKELIYKDDYDVFERYNDSKYSIPYNIRGVKKDNSTLSMQVLRIGNAYKTFDNLKFDLMVMRDITEYINIKNKQQEENEKLNNILNNINIGVILIDENNKIESLNSIAENIIGINNPVNRKINKLFSLTDRYTNESFKIQIPRYLDNKNESIQNKSLILEKKNSEKRKVLYSISSIRMNNSVKIKGAVIVLQDITYKEKMEEELAKQEKLKSIGVLAGGIAHDFNNFLTSILGSIMLAKDTNNVSELKLLLQESENAINRAVSLTKQLMTFSKGDEPKREVVDNLDILLNEYITFALRGSNIKVNYEKSEDKIWNCEIDKNQISQVIHNIVINAKQAMLYGGELFCKIENFEFFQDEYFFKHKMLKGKYIKITIKDTGIGIKEENLKNIFDPYFTTKETGTGLGLSITYSIIKKHNGEIIVTSEEGEGTEIIIFLPITNKKFHLKKKNVTNKKLENIKLTVLIMDDEEMILKILSRIIEKEGHSVIKSKTGEEAYSIYNEYFLLNKHIDLVITDLTIPNGMGGEELAQKILKLDENAKIIVSSGYYNSPVISNYHDYGFKASLQKPYKINEVKEAIFNAIYY